MLKYLLQITQLVRLNLAESKPAAYVLSSTPTTLQVPRKGWPHAPPTFSCKWQVPELVLQEATWKGKLWPCRVTYCRGLDKVR